MASLEYNYINNFAHGTTAQNNHKNCRRRIRCTYVLTGTDDYVIVKNTNTSINKFI